MLNLLINKGHLNKALEFTWKGMLSIFIVIGIIIAAVTLLNYLNARSLKKKEQKKDGDES